MRKQFMAAGLLIILSLLNLNLWATTGALIPVLASVVTAGVAVTVLANVLRSLL